MRALRVGAGLFALACLAVSARADVLKPYVVLMLDTSGSMTSGVTDTGPPTCGGIDNRLNHARCAINKLVNSYGDMVFALGRFRETPGGTVGAGQSCDANSSTTGGGADQCTTSGPSCNNCNCNGRTTDCTLDADCTAALRGDARGEMLTGLVDGGNQAAATWTDFQCGTCGGQGAALASQPEIWGTGSWTPLGGYMASAQRYWNGQQATDGSQIWPQNVCAGGTNPGTLCTSAAQCTGGGTCTGANPGFDPIRNDPTKTAFLPVGCDPNPATCGSNCCVEQCRSYITIMLTDGDETCGGNAELVAQDMLTTIVDNRQYRVETKVIGFGVTPGDSDIEAYAHAGGAPDLPGVNEGFYANDEASLQLALTQILADAVKVESCNGNDDDCDGLIDEDFKAPASVPGLGGMCSNGQLGQCARTGTLECRVDGAGLQCNAVTVTPGVEALPCNGLDDDCDGRIDENLGCTSCVATGEICDGNDNDCDGVADQVCRCSNDINARCDNVGNDCGAGTCQCTPITRPCGTGTCAGIETCTAPNTFTGCTAQPVTTETCDGADNDCDGICDGYQLDCSEQVQPCDPAIDGSCPATDSLGHPSKNPIAQNICRPGVKTCPVGCGGNGDFGICSNEVLPCGPDAAPGQGCDICNGQDDDCDNVVDEDFQDADCSTNCGIGRTLCTAGMITCNSTPATSDTTCDNNDDDCDGMIDEDWECPDTAPMDGVCDVCGVGQVCMGKPQCIAGLVECVGGPINNESCNCLDDDCDNSTDEQPPAICPTGSVCTSCQCAFTCAQSEFPCPLGKKCDTRPTIGTPEQMCTDNLDNDNDGTINDGCAFCINDPCFNVSCPPMNGSVQTCIPKPGFPNEPQCVDTCALIEDTNIVDFPPCSGANICVDSIGECRPNDCQTFPSMCMGTATCVVTDGLGACVDNPCATTTCEAGTYCVGGSCVQSCADVDCPDGERCRMGVCEEDPCGEPCPFGQQCRDDSGRCIEDPCKDRNCFMGQWCNPNTGQCEEDACVTSDVTCPNPGEVCRGGSCFDPDGFEVDASNEKRVTVGGGGCSSGGGDNSLVFALALLPLLVLRRRRAVVLVAAASAMSLQLSCSVNEYCLNCAVDDSGIATDDTLVDDGGLDAIDAACEVTGGEICDGFDNDCDGLVDNGILPDVGTACANQMGACAGGKLECDGGKLECDKQPVAESCDGIDNNCNGPIDEGDPGGGGKCGTDLGECIAGNFRCAGGAGCDSSANCTTNCCLVCENFIDHRMDPEECNGRDDNCNGMFDENITGLGACTWPNATDEGECNIGTLACMGGAQVCQNAVFPKFELCNSADDDCDTLIDEVFNKQTDPNNCMNCGTVCPTPSKTCVGSTNAGANCTLQSQCTGGTTPQCAINSQRTCTAGVCGFTCNVGFINLDGQAANGCEYRCFASGAEQCDGVDNDCNGMVDDGLTAPMGLCRSGGECGLTAPTPVCMGAQGWRCNYTGMVQFPETRCDDLDNDCDVNVDENQPNLGQACDDGRVGECRGTGEFTCNAAMRDGPAICTIDDPGQTNPSAQETCDDKDNDCDGKTDEGSNGGNLLGQEWVTIGNGYQIMKYEASRLDSTLTQQGTKAGATASLLAASPTGATQSGATATFTTQLAHGLVAGDRVRVSGVAVTGYNGIWTVVTAPTTTTFTVTLPTTGLAASGDGTVSKFVGACSKKDSIPWTNVTYPEALAVCQSMGASLCSETRWHQACGVVAPRTVTTAIDGTNGTRIEAEDFLTNQFNGGPETACTGTTDDDGDGRVNDGCPVNSNGRAESGLECSNNTDNDSDTVVNDGCPEQVEGAETACTDTTDNDGDGTVNDGCPTHVQGVGPETACTGTTDDDSDGRVNDGCAIFELGAGAETNCTDTTDNDGDGRRNDGCPAHEVGTGPETACGTNNDNDGDGRVNDGCPIVTQGIGAETSCTDTTDNDLDGRINDGCPQQGGLPETSCTDNNDNDNDGRVNDGCPVHQEDGETNCTDTNDNDGDGSINDGCPEFVLGPGAETNCTDTNDNDGDGRQNDGCPVFSVGAGAETNCTDTSDNDGDGRTNDGCPTHERGTGPETVCGGTADDDSDGRVNDGCPTVQQGVGPEVGGDCSDNVDDDNDGFVNDGCPTFLGGGETGDFCLNGVDDDGDGDANDGCPSVGPQTWAEDYTPANPNLTGPQQHSGISNMRAVTNDGASVAIGNVLTQSPVLTYQVNVAAANDWRLYVRMYSAVGEDDMLHVGISTSPTPVAPTATLITSVNAQWVWMQSPAFTLTAGTNYVRLFMGDDGLKVDAIFLVRGTTVQPPTTLNSAGGNWSYATNTTTYQPMTCNGADYSAANDNIFATGTAMSCYADHAAGDVFDLSGNVKEWTLARAPGQNPIRGGASSDIAQGTSCPLNFTLGTDTFFFPNVGFRCCR